MRPMRPRCPIAWNCSEGDRAGFIRALARAVGGRNQPGHYAFELRVVCCGAQADVFVVPAAVPDARFAYRTAAVPAAIHPVTAAALMRLAAMRLAGRARLRVYEKTLSTLIQRPVSFESGLNWFQPNKAFESGFTFPQ